MEQPFYLRTYPSDTTLNNQFIQNLLLGPEIITCLCVLFYTDKLLTSINCCKTLYQPNSFAYSLTNLLYWAYWAHPLFLPGFGLRFVTLQLHYRPDNLVHSVCVLLRRGKTGGSGSGRVGSGSSRRVKWVTG